MYINKKAVEKQKEAKYAEVNDMAENNWKLDGSKKIDGKYYRIRNISGTGVTRDVLVDADAFDSKWAALSGKRGSVQPKQATVKPTKLPKAGDILKGNEFSLEL
ncbi:hypothetical protein HY639_01240 [Candidatus Woesearchaeota archaeon]|nr:hypothetical protein [Candidatus Woesearchaeota archaeon]